MILKKLNQHDDPCFRFKHKTYLLSSTYTSIEVKVGSQEIAQWPTPFRTLYSYVTMTTTDQQLGSGKPERGPTHIMIIQPLRNSRILSIIRIIIVRPILHIDRIQSLQTQRPTQDLVGKFQSMKSMFLIEEFGCDRHGDGEIATELIVGPFASWTGFEDVLVDTSTIDDCGVDVIFGVIRWV